MIDINMQRKFTHSRDHEAFSVVRVNNHKIRSLGGRNNWVKITSDKSSVYRMIRGGGVDPDFPEDAIELDYETAVEELGIPSGQAPIDLEVPMDKPFYPCQLHMEPVSGNWHIICAHWYHPNPGYRVPIQISMVSFALGCIGLILGLISMFT